MTTTVQTERIQTSAQQASILDVQQRLGRVLAAHLILAVEQPLDAARLEHALRCLCAQHEILRTSYRTIAGLKRPVQEIHAEPRFTLVAVDGDVDLARRQAVELLSEVPVVVSLVSQQLLISVVLASADEQSLRELGEQLLMLYRGESLPVFDGLQYADYSEWQAGLGTEDIGRQGRTFWQTLYAKHEIAHRLPCESLVEFAMDTAYCERTSAAVLQGLMAVCAEADLQPGDALQFLWGAFLARLSKQDHLMVAAEVDGRTAELMQTVGHLASRLPVAFALQVQRSVRENLAHFVTQLALSRSWQDCLNELDTFGERTEQWPLFNYGCVFRADADERQSVIAHLDDWKFEKLHLRCVVVGNLVKLQFAYRAQLFQPGLMAVWMDQFIEFVDQATRDFDQVLARVQYLDVAQHALLQQRLDRRGELPAQGQKLLHGLFEATVKQFPEHIALHVDGVELTYAELDRRANRLANVLYERGVGSDQVIAVYGGRSVDIVIALLGILKAGGAYLPLDPTYPAERLSFMLRDAAATCLIALQPLHPDITPAERTIQVSLEERPRGDAERVSWAECGSPADLAYVIYTSGSTGRPKGVMVSHANACASTQARFLFYRQSVLRFLMLSSFSFDSSVAGIFWTLGQGGTLFLPSETEYRDPSAIAALIKRHEISHFLGLPSFYAQILEHLHAAPLVCAIVAGEACPTELGRCHRQMLPQVLLVNEYGPSESSVWCSACVVEESSSRDRVPIGTPVPGACIHLLNDEANPAGIGREAELYVGGAGVARGYLRRPELTASRFLPDPFAAEPGQRMYRTGDLTCSRLDGLLDYLGREDSQLKLRGFRIELGEIESCLAQLDEVCEAAVVVREAAGEKQLAAFVRLRAGREPEVVEPLLLERLRQRLPEYMVPAFVRVLERFPETPNGKLDRNALRAMEPLSNRYVAPQTELQAALAYIWQEVLRLQRVGIKDNFFSLGGHSLLVTQIRSRVQAELGVSLPLRAFFAGDTIERLEQQIEMHRDSLVTESKVDALEALFCAAEER